MDLKRFTIFYLICIPLAIAGTELVTGVIPDPNIGLPVDPADLDFSGETYGIWPYGVRGNTTTSHPEGHPGIDFSWNHTGEVYAVAAGFISEVKTNNHGQNVVYQRSAANLLVEFEYAMGTLAPGKAAGVQVRQGELIGYASIIVVPRTPTPLVIYMIHFGTHRSTLLTWHTEPPSRYFNAAAIAQLGTSVSDPGTVMNKSAYAERVQYPLLANPTGPEFQAMYVKIPSETGWVFLVAPAALYVILFFIGKKRNASIPSK
jgi:hypothetical protein